jgi:hypothetical protein
MKVDDFVSRLLQNFSIALTETEKGEAKAQTCDIA